MSGQWKAGDPVLRGLRVVATIAFLVMLAILVIDPGRRDPTIVVLLFGSIMLALGFPVALSVPGIWTKGDKKDPPDEP
jgi:hypothetical protein